MPEVLNMAMFSGILLAINAIKWLNNLDEFMKCSRIKKVDVLRIVLAVGGLCQVAFSQTSSLDHLADQQLPSYEVATIKPSDGNGFVLSLRMYILAAFDLPTRSSEQLMGPAWISQKSYDIHGKPPDAMREAMSKMAGAQRDAQERLMKQALLADRFKLKYHIEMRKIRVYKLVLAKGDLLLKENSDSTNAGAKIRNRGQATEIEAKDATISGLVGLLQNAPEIAGYSVIDKTGLTGRYDFSLKWRPPGVEENGKAAVSSVSDAPSLFTAVQELLGLRLVVAKAPAKVVIIDHIEPPSPN